MMELKDPNTGQIKTSIIVLSGVGIVGLLFFLGRGGGSSASNGGVVSGGQSSGISDQLGSLSDAVANLAGRLDTSQSANSGTGSGNNPNPTAPSPTPTSTSPTPTLPTTYQTWLQQILSRIGNPPATNPTNPNSPVAPVPNSSWINLPGGILPPQLEGVIGSGDINAYHNFINQYTGIANFPAAQNNTTGSNTTFAQKLAKLRQDIVGGNLSQLRSDIADLNAAGGSNNSSSLETINTAQAIPSVPSSIPSPTSLYDAPTLPGVSPAMQTQLNYYYSLRQSLLSQYTTPPPDATIQPVP